jgi:FAD:protein FMN transferase
LRRLSFLVVVLLLLSCQGTVIRISRPLLGTMVNLTFIAKQEGAPEIAGAVFGEIDRIEALMGPGKPASDINRLNDKTWAGPVTVSRETYNLIKKSARISDETGGCFDVTVAPIERLWDCKNKNFVPPARGEMARLLPLVNHRNMLFFPERTGIAFARQGMKIDPGTIARGYAVERGLEILKAQGVRSGIVEIGGGLQAMGTGHDKPWAAIVRHPRINSLLLTIELEDRDAVATSGDYECFVMHGKKRYRQNIDPRTGYPADTFSSVTVISKNAELSNAYAAAIFVMGLAGAREFLERHAEIAVVLVDQKINLYVSKRLKDRMKILDRSKAEWL